MLCYDGKVSLFAFTIACTSALLPEVLLRLEFENYLEFFQNIWLVHVFLFLFLNVLAALAFRGFSFQVAVRATFLGYIFGAGILVFVTAPSTWQIFGAYMSVMATFHYSEFLSIAWTNPRALTIDSFILNHSVAYGVAACSSWLEFIAERHFLPEMKEPYFISYFGLILCFAGEVLRKLAMFTARHNFNHIVQSEKAEDHQLVTHGVYQYFRHPSYVGWFYWSIGTQLILQNPFCAVAYALASWRFFHDRVLIEEITLLNFFGEAYIKYQKQVGTGLPFIGGYKVGL